MKWITYLLLIPLIMGSFTMQAMRRVAVPKIPHRTARPGYLMPAHTILRHSSRIANGHSRNLEISISDLRLKHEKQQEYKNRSSNNRQSKDERFDSYKNKSYWAAGGLAAAALAAWQFYSTDEVDAEENNDNQKNEIEKVIEAIKFEKVSTAADIIRECLEKDSSVEAIDIITKELINCGAMHARDILAGVGSLYRLQIGESILKNSYFSPRNDAIKILTDIIWRNYDLRTAQETCLSSSISNLIIENIFTILNQDFGSKLISQSINRFDENFIENIEKIIINNFQKVNATKEGTKVINDLLRGFHPEFCKKLLPIALNNFEELNPSTLKFILRRTNCDAQLSTLIKKDKINSLHDIARTVFFMSTCSANSHDFYVNNNLYEKKDLPQSLRHLTNNLSWVFSNGELDEFVEAKELSQAADLMLSKEKELNRAGYYTFFHGQRREYYFLEKLYTLLWEIKSGQKIRDYIFPWLVKPVMEKQTLIKESEKRQLLLKQFVPADGKLDQKDTLFLNYALFGNLRRSGESSANYMAYNRNVRFLRLTPEDIFNLFDSNDLYLLFKNEIQDLCDQYNYLSNRGNGLLFGIPKDKINDVIYFAKPFGEHRKENDRIKTDEIMETILAGRQYTDEAIFCMPMTFDIALDPHSGIKIFPFVTGDSTKLKELKAKEEMLFEKIRKKYFAQKPEADKNA